ncbi:MAG: type II toxin-antitoxin system RelE/ParE family toxin [Clostridia bacterium]|jgi:toxin ParE1/3/4
MRILMSNEAHQDIDSIFEYILRDSIKYANETSENIYSCISNLENAPYLGRYVPELSTKHFRELIYKNYRIVYDFSEDSNTIYIHFVVHSKRNFKSFYKSYIKNNF